MSISNQELFENRPVFQAILALIIPTILSNIVTMIYSLADTFYVGFLASGVQSAAVSLCAPLLLSFNAINNLFGVGASTLLSRALGEKREDLATKAAAFGFWGALIFSVVFSLGCLLLIEPLLLFLGTTSEAMEVTADYLFYAIILGAPFSILNVVLAFLIRAEGRSLQASIGTMSGALLNILLDPLFIFVFNLGAMGAAMATCLSNALALIYFLLYLRKVRAESLIRYRAEKMFSKPVVVPVLIVGLPAAIQNLLNVLSQILMNNQASLYGTGAIAATGIAFRVANVLIYIAIGISQGVMPLIGYTYGARLLARLKKTISTAFWLDVLVIGFLAILMMLFSGPIISVFTPLEPIIETGSVLLRGMVLAMPFIAVDFIGVGVFQAAGKGMVAFWLAVFRKVICEIPMLYLFTAWFGLIGLSYSQLAAEVLTSVLSMTLMSRFLIKTFRNKAPAPEKAA